MRPLTQSSEGVNLQLRGGRVQASVDSLGETNGREPPENTVPGRRILPLMSFALDNIVPPANPWVLSWGQPRQMRPGTLQ